MRVVRAKIYELRCEKKKNIYTYITIWDGLGKCRMRERERERVVVKITCRVFKTERDRERGREREREMSAPMKTQSGIETATGHGKWS